ncbi:response regulator [Solidesulfovibrio magneticus]|uniref:histidine kinase n=1 Tax=Solidesulfovibrio magneticus (strain ATCC 700980 / DSM 13731 / RS-1) TaxID=573370 RepID=C4XJS2_SOLM1|nr:response regulator [Solidesulfovibrio magneticus]BAH74277.1 two-component hybrid sensor and regulator [Solidesulfovibrio magneticus RS-1]
MTAPTSTPLSLRLHLAGLVAACVLPVWLCAAYLVHYAYTAKKNLIQSHMVEVARNLSLAVDREFAILLAAAEGLATSPALQTGDFPVFRRQVKTLLAGYPASDIIVAEASGQQVFNSYLPEGAPLPKRAVRETVRRVFETGRPGISNLFRGAVTGRYLVSLDMPVWQGAAVGYDLAMTVPVARFDQLLAAERLPAGWTAAVIDAAAVVAARAGQAETWAGRPAGELLAGLETSRDDVAAFETIRLDGEPALAAYDQAEGSGWGVAVAVPRSVLLAEVQGWLWWTGGGVLTLSLGGFLLALALARRIAGSIDTLVPAAEALGQGLPLPQQRFGLAETAAVGEALSRAADLLAARAAERRQAEDARQQVEARLAEREHIFRIVADNSHDWEFWDGPDGLCRWVSPACARVSGHPAEAFLGPGSLTVRDLIHPEDRAAWDAHLDSPEALEAVHEELHFRILRADGRVAHIAHVCGRILGPGGENLGRRGANRDITEQHHHERELRRAKEMADAGSRAKSEFLANMSHEVRTPINGVVGMLQLLETTALTEEQQEYVAMAGRAAGRLSRLLGDILDLSKVESGALVLQQTPFELEELRQAILDVFGPMARNKNLALSVDLAQALPRRVMGDDVRLRQILLNLVGNAVKYTDSGFVHVAVFPGDPDSPPREGAPFEVVFVVADTGRGIPGHKLDSVFSPFVQTDPAAGPQGGVGLGLAIVKRLVELMGGRIHLCSVEGQGTSMRAVVPLTPLPAEAQVPAPTGSQAETASGHVVLVVEDDDMNRMAAQRMLVKLGFTVHTACNGQEALDFLAGQTPQAQPSVDLILMDIQMPVMDGLEATRRIRENADGRFDPLTPIIALTAYAMAGDRERFLQAGLDDHLAKPVKVAEMLDAMKRALDRRAEAARKKA